MGFQIIVACCNKNGIGKGNTIPWYLSGELVYFKKITTHTTTTIYKNVVVMGRKTWESISEKHRPLSDRINIVLTRNQDYKVPDGVFTCNSLEEVDTLINSIDNSSKTNVFLIGGGSLYKECLDKEMCDKIFMTKVYKKYECDVFFPKIPEDFVLNTVSDFCEEKDIYYRKFVYDKNGSKKWKNQEEQQYMCSLNNIIKLGYKNIDRTGIGTLSQFGLTFKYDISKTFPLLTTKRMWVRAIFEELKFYLSGKTDNQILNDKGITIWKGNTTREFLDSRGLSHYPENDMGESYGFNFRHYGAEYKTCKEDYTGKGFDQLEYVIDLIKNNPSSRRIIIDLWNGSTLANAALPPCLCKYQFYVNSTDNKLDLMIYLRSSDFFLANNWNVCTGAFLVYMICNLEGINYTPGMLTVVTGDTHIYTSHIKHVEENLKREPRPYPMLKVNKKRNNIMDFEFEDFEVIGYEPYPNIKAEMAV